MVSIRFRDEPTEQEVLLFTKRGFEFGPPKGDTRLGIGPDSDENHGFAIGFAEGIAFSNSGHVFEIKRGPVEDSEVEPPEQGSEQ